MTTPPSKLSPLFLDTAYIFALVNTRDQWHGLAVEWQQKLEGEQRPLLTTELILVEIADGLSAIKFRAQASQIIAALQSSPHVEIVPFTSQLLADALTLYEQRQDKDWGLTDCASFVVMRARGIVEALTVDEHFQQAGFQTLSRRDF
jgi:predicted nucleic acid-binding protein